MSAASKYFKENPIVGYAAVLAINLIVVFTTYALDKNTAKTKLINAKADKTQVDELEKRMNNAATVEYVDKKIIEHERNEEKLLKPIQDDISMIKNYILYNKLPDKTN